MVHLSISRDALDHKALIKVALLLVICTLSEGCTQSSNLLSPTQEHDYSVNESGLTHDASLVMRDDDRFDLGGLDAESESNTEPDADIEDLDSAPLDQGRAPSPPGPYASICSPREISYHHPDRFAASLTTLVDEVNGSFCSLAHGIDAQPSVQQLRTNAEFGEAGQTLCDEDGCWLTLQSGVKQWREDDRVFDQYASTRRLWTGVIDARRHLEDQSLEVMVTGIPLGEIEVERLLRRWDGEGRLTHESYGNHRNMLLDIEYTWSMGRLSAVNSTRIWSRADWTNYELIYDNFDRLIQSRIRKVRHYRTEEWQSEWTYTPQGQPDSMTVYSVLLTIHSNGDEPMKPWLRQSWGYAPNGHLSSRSVMLSRRVQAGQFEPIHSYGVVYPHHHQAWERGAPGWNAPDACFKLPTSFMHGYPVSGGMYDLGWSFEDRPREIAASHGASVEADAALGWYGHFGPSSGSNPSYDYWLHAVSIDSLDPEEPITIKIDTEYDSRGRPRVETVYRYEASIDSIDQDAIGLQPPIELARRTWLWDRDQLVEDRLERLDRAPRVLSFSYNDQGKLITRILRRADQVIAQHEWSWREDMYERSTLCQIETYQIAYNSLAQQDLLDETVNDQSSLDTQHHYQTNIEGECDRLEIQGPEGMVLRLEYDDQNRLIRQIGGLSINPFGFDSVALTYADDTDLVIQLEILDPSGRSTETILHYEVNEFGEIVARRGVGDASTVYIESYEYLCK